MLCFFVLLSDPTQRMPQQQRRRQRPKNMTPCGTCGGGPERERERVEYGKSDTLPYVASTHGGLCDLLLLSFLFDLVLICSMKNRDIFEKSKRDTRFKETRRNLNEVVKHIICSCFWVGSTTAAKCQTSFSPFLFFSFSGDATVGS